MSLLLWKLPNKLRFLSNQFSRVHVVFCKMNKVNPGRMSYHPLSANKWKVANREILERNSQEVKGDLKRLPKGINHLIWFYQISGLSFFGYNRDTILKLATLTATICFLALLVSVNIPCLLNCRDGIFTLENFKETTRFTRSFVDYFDVTSGIIIILIAFRWGGKLRNLSCQIENLTAKSKTKQYQKGLSVTCFIIMLGTITNSLLIGANAWFNDEERIVHQDQIEEELQKSLNIRQKFPFSQSTFKKLSTAVMSILITQRGVIGGLIIYFHQLLHVTVSSFNRQIMDVRVHRTMVSSRLLEEQFINFRELDSILGKTGDFLSKLKFWKIIMDGIPILLNISILIYSLRTFKVFDSSVWIEVCKTVIFFIEAITILILGRKVSKSLKESRSFVESFNAFSGFLPASLQGVSKLKPTSKNLMNILFCNITSTVSSQNFNSKASRAKSTFSH